MFNELFLTFQVFFAPEGEGVVEASTTEPVVEAEQTTTEPVVEPAPETPAKSILGGETDDKAGETSSEEFTPIEQSEINFNLPEGQELDPEISTEFMTIVNDRTLSPLEQAQKYVDLQNSIMEKAVEAQAADVIATTERWEEEIKADKIVGGDKLSGIVEQSLMIIDQYGDKEFRNMLNITGLGSHISTVRFFNNLIGALGEGKLVQGSPPNSTNLSDADKLFDNPQ